MAFTTTNMGLKEWDLVGDNFSHSDLVANWGAIDVHDHTTGKGVQIPTGGITNLAVTGPKIAASSIDSSKVADGTLTDADLASPNNPSYRTIYSQMFNLTGGIAANTFYTEGASGVIRLTGAGSQTGVVAWPLTAADYAVAGKTSMLRIRAAWTTNGTAPAATFTIGLYPFTTSAGSLSQTVYTLGTVVPSSTVAVTTPGASSSNQVVSSDFALPANGQYIFGCVQTGASAAASNNTIIPFLQIHYT